MRFKRHSRLEGNHAFLSPSYYHWLNYDEDKLSGRWKSIRASIEGVKDHAYAAEAIELREFQFDESTTLGAYINDCIRFGMTAELILYYSDNCFGTADAISFENNFLRISDLKTGTTKASERQLEIYAALFCLEYEVDPYSIEIELRIYQDEECRIYVGDPATIRGIMDKIIHFNRHVDRLREEEVEDLAN